MRRVVERAAVSSPDGKQLAPLIDPYEAPNTGRPSEQIGTPEFAFTACQLGTRARWQRRTHCLSNSIGLPAGLPAGWLASSLIGQPRDRFGASTSSAATSAG